jgi:hypothetical protein
LGREARRLFLDTEGRRVVLDKGAELGSENITVIANGLGSSARHGKDGHQTDGRRSECKAWKP